MCTLTEIVTFSHTSTILHDIIHRPSPCGSGKGVWASVSTQWLAFGQSAGDPWWSGRHHAAGWWQTQGELLAGGMMDNGNSLKRWGTRGSRVWWSSSQSEGDLRVPGKSCERSSKDWQGTLPRFGCLLRNSDILCRLTLAVFQLLNAEVEAAFVRLTVECWGTY